MQSRSIMTSVRRSGAGARARVTAHKALAENGSRREAILLAAADLFAEAGFPSASTAALARRCAISKALVYHYYPSKEAILFDLLDDYTARLAAIARAVAERGEPPRARLAALVRGFLQEYEKSRSRHMVLLHDVKFLPAPGSARILRRERAIVRAVAELIASAYPRGAAPATALAMMLFGMINWTFTWLRPRGPIRYADFADAVLAMLDRGAPAAAGRLSRCYGPRSRRGLSAPAGRTAA